MRLAFCGKGGSGKSTLASLMARYLAAKSHPVIVMDGDINQHLGRALGFSEEELVAQKKLGAEPGILHEWVRGQNTRILSVDHVIETTPPGAGSNLMRFNDDTPVARAYELRREGMRFLALGGHSGEQVGATCYHGFTYKMGTYLNHLLDGPGEYFIGDMCAGADPFACSLASKYDAVFVVVEPTEKSAGVYEQCRAYGDPFGIPIHVVGNKIEDESDMNFIRARVGDALIGGLTRSPFLRRQDKGEFAPIAALEPENTALLSVIKSLADEKQRDWERYLRNNRHFLEKAARSWADALYKTDMMGQVDPSFRYENFEKFGKRAA